jgi:hypothetical protein
VDLRREAVRLRDELASTLRVSARISWGGLRELTVLVDDRAIFSRRQAGRMPRPGEIARIVQSLG